MTRLARLEARLPDSKGVRAIGDMTNLSVPPRPKKGWIEATRDFLGLSVPDLAKRLGTSWQQVYKFEASEIAGTIQLDTLQRVSRAMGCKLVYGLAVNTELASPHFEEVKARVIDLYKGSKRLKNLREKADHNEEVKLRAEEKESLIV